MRWTSKLHLLSIPWCPVNMGLVMNCTGWVGIVIFKLLKTIQSFVSIYGAVPFINFIDLQINKNKIQIQSEIRIYECIKVLIKYVWVYFRRAVMRESHAPEWYKKKSLYKLIRSKEVVFWTIQKSYYISNYTEKTIVFWTIQKNHLK